MLLEKREHPLKKESLAFPAFQWRAADLATHPIADLKLEAASSEKTAIHLRATPPADSTQREAVIRLQPFLLLIAIANGVWVSGSSPHAEIAYPAQSKDGRILIAEFSISQDELDKMVIACAKRLGIVNIHDLLSLLKEQEENISPKHLCRHSPFSTIASPLVTVVRESIEKESGKQEREKQDENWRATQEQWRAQAAALQQKFQRLNKQIEMAFQPPAPPPQQQEAPTKAQFPERDLPPPPKPEYWPTPEQIVQMTIINSLVPLL